MNNLLGINGETPRRTDTRMTLTRIVAIVRVFLFLLFFFRSVDYLMIRDVIIRESV